MDRIHHPTAAASPPAPDDHPTAGYPTAGSPGGTAPTVFTPWTGHMLIEEIRNVLLAAGVTPDIEETDQLIESLNTLFKGGRLLAVQVFTSSGTYTPTAGMAHCIVRAQGGGGGGSGASDPGSGLVSLGAPGTAGSYAEARLTAADIGASKAVTIGAGGAGGVGAAGVNGGDTSLGSLVVAPGGVAGGMLAAQSAPKANANGNFATAPTGGNIASMRGGAVGVTLALSTTDGVGGGGGRSAFGDGGYPVGGNANGAAAVNKGAGGGGCTANAGGVSNGGAGADGILIVMDYA